MSYFRRGLEAGVLTTRRKKQFILIKTTFNFERLIFKTRDKLRTMDTFKLNSVKCVATKCRY